MLRLILPSKKYIKGNTAYIKELYEKGEISKKELSDKIEKRKNTSTFLKTLKDSKTTLIYWLVDNKKFIGVLRLSKRLNKKLRARGGNIGYVIRPSERKKGYGIEILRLGLLKTKIQGLKKVRIDCRENNPASKKIIEANGGVFIDKLKIKGKGPASFRYYIDIK